MTSPADNQPSKSGGAKDGPEPYSAEAADAQMLRVPIISVAITGVVITVLAYIFGGVNGLVAGIIGTPLSSAFSAVGNTSSPECFATIRPSP